MASDPSNVIVIGGSFAGLATAQGLAKVLPATHRVLLIEPHSHFHYLFAFPRFAVLPKHEHKAFIPYTAIFASSPGTNHQNAVVQARVAQLHKNHVVLDREWQGSTEIPFDYLVVATGTRLQPPGTIMHDDKLSCVNYLKSYQERVKRAKSAVIVGGGALGVQMATDLRELYPEKEVTLVHSRDRLMPAYHEKLDQIIKERFAELGVKLITGSRVVLPPGGFEAQDEESKPVVIQLQNGASLTADLAIPAVGQTPNTQFLSTLPASSPGSLTNPANGFVRVRPTLQFRDPAYPHLYAVGDIADSGAHKAARPAIGQAESLVKNVLAMAEGREPDQEIVINPPGIHMTLGLAKNVVFRNPNASKGETEPMIIHQNDGQEDMFTEAAWTRRGIPVSNEDVYHL